MALGSAAHAGLLHGSWLEDVGGALERSLGRSQLGLQGKAGGALQQKLMPMSGVLCKMPRIFATENPRSVKDSLLPRQQQTIPCGRPFASSRDIIPRTTQRNATQRNTTQHGPQR